ncbi:MAG: DNA repair protein RecN [Thiomicrorhabdus sp.]|nr:DNA repair protein RecN [Thiomicrorhabdus sp.]
MLQELTIQNLALIEKLHLNFHKGFSTLTGETGAGKSILLDALGLTLGERADSSLVRHNTPRADVTAQFTIEALPNVQKWLITHELDEEQDCFLRRTVTPEGRSKAYINGRPVPASQLKKLGNLLIDIHGQHEHQSLLSSTKQLELLDAFAVHTPLVIQCKQQYQRWQTLQQQLEKRLKNQAEHQNKLDLLNFQNAEFNEIQPSKNEFETLSEEQRQQSHAKEIQLACQTAYEAIEGRAGATEQINQAVMALENIIDVSPQLQSNLEQLNSALIEVQEAAGEIQQYASTTEIDPPRLNEIEERLSQLFGLAKKYNIDPSELTDKQQQLQQELAELTQSEYSLESLKQNIEHAWDQFQTEAKRLQTSRQKSAKKLSQIVTNGMQTLGMPNGQFEVRLTALETPNISGLDKVAFHVTANKGQPLQPLAKVASGGELSRISLAIQVATAEVASLPTLIFDEVDVGIGGGIAEVVGKKMQQLGQHKQILSITHLAQVASHGDCHLRIEKQTLNEQTYTQVIELNSIQRVEELARMMGGLTLSEQTVNHAKEMLENAQRKNRGGV